MNNRTAAGNPEIEDFFGSSDLRALGILNVLRNSYPELEEDAIVASIGGERRAFEYMADPQSPWRVEAGYLLRDFIEQSWNVLNEMIEGKRPVDSNVEYRIPAEIFVDPTISTAEEYLQTHHNINQLDY